MKWEYQVVAINCADPRAMLGSAEHSAKHERRQRLLNDLGRQGWELVSVTALDNGEPVWGFFKRPLSS